MCKLSEKKWWSTDLVNCLIIYTGKYKTLLKPKNKKEKKKKGKRREWFPGGHGFLKEPLLLDFLINVKGGPEQGGKAK